MSRYFVDSAPVAVPEWDEGAVISDRRPNVIWIRARMDVATKGKVTSELFTLDKDGTLEAHAGANMLALLTHNIVRWDGPDLDTIACTPENIRRLDPTEPHIARVLEEIGIRNAPQPDPKGGTSPGVPSSPGGASPAEGSGMLKSPSRNAITGRHQSSDNLTPIS